MSKTPKIRFASGEPEVNQSTIWTLFAHKKQPDFFLWVQSLIGESKISFHKSGIIRLAKNSTEPRPAIFKWDHIPFWDGGVRPVFSVEVFLAALPPSHNPVPPIPEGVHWHPAPTWNQKLVFTVWQSMATPSATDDLLNLSGLFASLDLADGGLIGVSAHYLRIGVDRIAEYEIERDEQFAGVPDPTIPDNRAVGFVVGPQGVRVGREFAWPPVPKKAAAPMPVAT